MALTPAAFYVRDNASISAITFTGSTAGSTTLTTSGSPALAIGMVVWASGATYLGVITAGSANSWTLSASSTVASQTMVAFAGMTAGSVGWSSVTAWAPSTAYTVGQLRRQKNIASVFTASTSGSSATLTISAITSGGVAPNQSLFYAGSSTTPPTFTAYGTSTGGTGTMTMSGAVTIASQLMLSMLTPGNERVFVCVVAGTSGSTEPTWTLTRNSTTTDNTVTWREVTGQPPLNGDTTNAGVWTASGSVSSVANSSAGTVIVNTAKTHVFICTAGSVTGTTEPTWNTTTGTSTSADNNVTWLCLGPVGNFGAWAASAARLSHMLNSFWSQAGNYIFLAADHAEVQGTPVSITSISGTPASPNYVISVAAATVPPTSASWSAGASVTTVGPNALTLINSTAAGIGFYGVTASAGTGATISTLVASAGQVVFDGCALAKLGTSSITAAITIGALATTVNAVLNNTTVRFGSTSDKVDFRGRVRWQNTPSAIAGSTIPTTLISVSSCPILEIVGVDLSGLGSGIVAAGGVSGQFTLSACKLAASTVLYSSPSPGFQLDAINCDSAATDYQKARYAYAGTLTAETTVVRTSGAVVDVTPVSDKIVTNTNTSWINPFVSMPYGIQEVTVGSSATITVYGVYNGAALPNNDEIWIDVEYAGSASSTLTSIATTTKSNVMATAAAVTADTSAWDSAATTRVSGATVAVGAALKVASNTGRVFIVTAIGTGVLSGSEPVGYASAVDGSVITDGGATVRAAMRFKLTSTFTPQLVGPVYVRPKAGKNGTNTYYIDPTPVLS